MSELIFYTNPMSRGRIVRWMLEEIGQPYETRVVGFGPSMKSPDYLRLNPMGKVPTLLHGNAVVTECAAICAYLADAFPQAGLAPAPDTPERGAYYRWLFFGAGPVEAAATNGSMDWQTEDPQLQGRLGYGSLDRVLDTLESLFDGRRWILGEQFSAADVYLGAQMAWGMEFGTLPERPGFRPYVDRLMAREAAQRAQALDNALVAEQEKAAG